MEIEYWNDHWKKCDFICQIGTENVGVSVTRGMHYPDPNKHTIQDAIRLLNKKLYGLVVARTGIWDENSAFTRSILHIWVQNEKIANNLMYAYEQLDVELKDDIIVLLTIAAKNASYIFFDDEDPYFIRKK